MKPQRFDDIRRTQNDTIPISFICSITDDSGTYFVPDNYVVVLVCKTTPVTRITGTAKGDSSGTFLFPVTAIKALAGTIECEVEVNDGSYIQTIGYGKIVQRAEIG